VSLRGRSPGWPSVATVAAVASAGSTVLAAASRSATSAVQAASPPFVQALEIGGEASSSAGLAVAPRRTFYLDSRRAASAAVMRLERFFFSARERRLRVQRAAEPAQWIGR
jgi:hypothetical protein